MANEVQVAITIAEKQALQALTKLTNKTKEYADEATKSSKQADSAFTKLSGTLKGKLALGAVGAVTAGFAAFGVALKRGIELAQVQEDAINDLNNQLKISGDFTRQTSQDLQTFASELQKVTRFGDETILSQLAFAKAMGASVDQSKQIVAAAADMSASLNIDLNSAVRNISKTLGGYAGELGEVIPELKNLTKEQLQAGQGIDFLAKRFQGAATGSVQTYSGATDQLSNAFGDLLEELGKFVTKNETIINAIKSATKGIADFAEGANKARIAVKDFFTNFTDAQTSKDVELIDEKIKDLTESLAKANRIAAGEGEGLLEWWAGQGRGAADAAKEAKVYENQIAQLTARRKELLAVEEQSNQKQSAQTKAKTATGESPEVLRKQQEAEKLKMLERQKNIEIQAIRDEFDLLQAEKEVAQIEQKNFKNEQDIETIKQFEQAKIAIAFDAQMQKAELIENSEQRMLEKRKLIQQKQLADERVNAKAEMRINQERVRSRMMMVGGFGMALSQASALAKQGTAEQQGLAAASATINTYAAATRAYRDFPFPANVAVMATTIASGLAQVANIRKQSFATGGVVGGNFTGATGGLDNQQANVRTGEVFLNGQQQRRLFDIANNRDTESGSSRLIDAINRLASAPMVVEIDGKEVARSVRNARLDGMTI